ncbi:MAG: hypothetical protein ABSF47_02840 [Minisyncoccia bacterium]|jgi:hypothetical protein
MSARKNASFIISGAGWIASFIDKLIKALKNLGISDGEIHSLASDTDNGTRMIERIASIIHLFLRVSQKVHKINVERLNAKKLESSIRSWIASCHQGENASKVLERLRIEPYNTLPEIELVRVRFKELSSVNVRDMERIFANLGLYPVGIRELKVFVDSLGDDVGNFAAFDHHSLGDYVTLGSRFLNEGTWTLDIYDRRTTNFNLGVDFLGTRTPL